jgi:hypothetical protein
MREKHHSIVKLFIVAMLLVQGINIAWAKSQACCSENISCCVSNAIANGCPGCTVMGTSFDGLPVSRSLNEGQNITRFSSLYSSVSLNAIWRPPTIALLD